MLLESTVELLICAVCRFQCCIIDLALNVNAVKTAGNISL